MTNLAAVCEKYKDVGNLMVDEDRKVDEVKSVKKAKKRHRNVEGAFDDAEPDMTRALQKVKASVAESCSDAASWSAGNGDRTENEHGHLTGPGYGKGNGGRGGGRRCGRR